MRKPSFFLTLSLLFGLVSCGGGAPSASSSSFPHDFSSTDHLPEEDLSSYSLSVVARYVLENIAAARWSYPSPLSRQQILEDAGMKKGERIEATWENAFRLLQAAFSSVTDPLPASGIRKYGSCTSAPKVSSSTSAEGKEALSWYVGLGLYAEEKFEGEKKLTTDEEVKPYLTRLHAYIGSSPVNDFYSYANADRLYDGSKTTNPEAYFYEQKIVDNENIENFFLSFVENQDPELIIEAKKPGGLSPLKPWADELLNASSGSFYSVASKIAKESGSHLFPTLYGATTQNGNKIALLAQGHLLSNASRASSLRAGFQALYSSLGFDSAESRSLTNSLISLFTRLSSSSISSFDSSSPFCDYLGCYFDPSYSITGSSSATLKSMRYLASLSVESNLELLKSLLIANLGYTYRALLPESTLSLLGLASTSSSTSLYEGLSPALQQRIVNDYLNSVAGGESTRVLSDLVESLSKDVTAGLSQAGWISEKGVLSIQNKLTHMKHRFLGVVSEDSKSRYENVATWGNGLFEALKSGLSGYASNLLSSSQSEENPMALTWEYSDLFTANASYYPTENTIELTFGLVASYGGDLKSLAPEELYGGLSLVIGHEITHAFDANGVLYDEKGNAALSGSILSQEDSRAYSDLQGKAEKLYNVEVLPGLSQSGSTTLSENIADIGGLSLAEKSYQKALAQEGQACNWKAFFTSVARHYYSSASRYAYRLLLQGDVHSFGRARVNPLLSNDPQFLSAFNIQEGDAMYFDESLRAKFL